MSNELSVVHENLLEEEAAEESDALLGEGDKVRRMKEEEGVTRAETCSHSLVALPKLKLPVT